MSGDEALALVAGDARADLRELYDEHSKLLPVREWPDTIARSVKAFRDSPLGGTSIVMNDSAAARRVVLEQTGTLKNPLGKVATSLARLLAGNFEEETDG